MTTRLGLGPYLLGIAVLLAAQVGAAVVLSEISDVALVAAILALQALKVPLSAARSFDLGNAPDDGFLAIVPLANIGLLYQNLGRTPKEDVRAARIARWSRGMPVLDAFGKGFTNILRTLPAFALVIAALVGSAALLDDWVPRKILVWAVDPVNAATAATAGKALLGVAVLSLAYLLFQLPKQSRASLASWIPALAMVPCLFIGGALSVAQGKDAGGAVYMLSSLGLYVAWLSVFGSLGATAIYGIANRARSGDGGVGQQLSAATDLLSARGADLIAVHGGLNTVSWIGFQVVIPGFILTTRWIFADLVAIFEPDAPLDRRAARLAGGSNSRRAMLLWYLPTATSLVVGLLVGSYFDDGGVNGFVTMSMVAAYQISTQQAVFQLALSVIAVEIGRYAAVEMYHHRVAELAELDKPA